LIFKRLCIWKANPESFWYDSAKKKSTQLWGDMYSLINGFQLPRISRVVDLRCNLKKNGEINVIKR